MSPSSNKHHLGSLVTTSSPGWSLVHWRQTGRAWCLKIIEKVVEARTTGNKKCSDSCPILKSCKLQSPEVLLGKTISSEKEGRACRGERDFIWGSWRLNYFETVSAHYVGCAGDVGGDVSDMMVEMLKIAMSYLVTWIFTGTWQVHLQELPFLLLLLRISGFTTSICIFDCSYFFWIHGHPPHIMFFFY